jgi:steroid delta-isomerase-like uncharacterized protein
MSQNTTEQNEAIVRRWFEEVWNQKRTDTVYEILSPDSDGHGTSETGADLRGPKGFLEFHSRLIDAFPDIHIDVQDCFGTGDKVAVRWTATMHHRGRGLGIEPTGAEIKIDGMAIARFGDDGKIVEHWDNYDKLSMFQQIDAAKSKSASA